VGEDFVEPDLVHIDEFDVVQVKASSIVVSVSCDIYVQDGVTAGIELELDRWEPQDLNRARLTQFDN
jgi:hypothetical protein